MLATRFSSLISALSQITAPVATTSGKSPANISPSPKTAVTLRCDSEITSSKGQLINSINIKDLKIMAQKNEMSARALTMEEMENVNGGAKNFYCDLMEKDGSVACSKFI